MIQILIDMMHKHQTLANKWLKMVAMVETQITLLALSQSLIEVLRRSTLRMWRVPQKIRVICFQGEMVQNHQPKAGVHHGEIQKVTFKSMAACLLKREELQALLEEI